MNRFRKVTDASSRSRLFRDMFIADQYMADTNYLHGDGLFPLVNNQGGFVDHNGEVVASDPPSMMVGIKDLLALVDGRRVGNRVLADVVKSTVTMSTADPINPRIDLIVIEPKTLHDDEDDDDKRVCGPHFNTRVVQGVAASDPGVPDVPAGSVLLAEIFVAAGVTQITANDITDRRDYLLDIECMDERLSKADEGLSDGLDELSVLTSGHEARIAGLEAHQAPTLNTKRTDVDLTTDIDDASSDDYGLRDGILTLPIGGEGEVNPINENFETPDYYYPNVSGNLGTYMEGYRRFYSQNRLYFNDIPSSLNKDFKISYRAKGGPYFWWGEIVHTIVIRDSSSQNYVSVNFYFELMSGQSGGFNANSVGFKIYWRIDGVDGGPLSSPSFGTDVIALFQQWHDVSLQREGNTYRCRLGGFEHSFVLPADAYSFDAGNATVVNTFMYGGSPHVDVDDYVLTIMGAAYSSDSAIVVTNQIESVDNIVSILAEGSIKTPTGTYLTIETSADGKVNWEEITLSQIKDLVNKGSDLYLRFSLTRDPGNADSAKLSFDKIYTDNAIAQVDFLAMKDKLNQLIAGYNTNHEPDIDPMP